MQLHQAHNPTSIALLDSAFRNASIVFYLADASDGRVIHYLSPNIEKVLGYSAQEFLSSPAFWREHLLPEDAERVLNALNSLAQKGHQTFEYRMLDARGEYRWFSDEIEFVHPEDGSPDYVQGYWQDISAQKLREADLQEQSHSLQSILDSLPQRLVWKDRNSVFQGCNQAAAREIGLAFTEEIIGKSDFDFHADHRVAEYLRMTDEAVMATGLATYHADVPAKQDGVWLDVTKVPLRQANGTVSGVLISYEDVSEKKRTKFALGNFRRAVEQSSSVVIITDTKGGIEYVNPRFVQLFGYGEHEVLAKNPRFLKEDGVGPERYRELWKAINGGQSWHGEFLNRAKDGKLYWLSVSISPIFDENGTITHFIALEDDITPRKQLEIELKQQLAFTQTLMNALPHPVYYKSRDGVYRGCNRAFDEFMGLGEGEIVGKTVFEIAPPELAQKYLEMDNELFAHPGLQVYETKLRHRDGSLHDIISHKATFSDERGAVAGIIGSAFDISDRKRVEAALQKSEERFRTIANYTYNWENWINRDGKLLWVNPAVERITGFPPEECYAMPDFPARLIHPDDWPVAGRHYAESLAGISHRDLECRIVRKDGEIRWVEVAVQQVYDENGNNIGHRSSVRDVTDRRQATDQLHELKDMLQTVLDHIPQGVFWKDLDGIYLGGNSVFAHDIGLRGTDELRGRSDVEIFPAEEAEKFRNDDRKVMCGNKPFTSVEEQFTDSTGIRHWVLTSKMPLHNSRGEVVGLLGTYADLTELKQMDAELRESESRLREITATAAEGVYVMSDEGKITFINPEAERLLGRQAEELLGKPGQLLFTGVDPSLTESSNRPCRIILSTLAEKQYVSEEDQFVQKDGTAFNVSIRATPIMRDGEYAGAVVAFHDITEQKLTQKYLHETLQELQAVNTSLEQRVSEQTQQNIEKERLLIQQSRSAAMGEMISNIAHQWRQPLSTLGLVVQNILLDYKENQLGRDELEKYVATAQQCVTRMSETIDDFRDFFRPDKHKVFFNLHQAVKESLRLLEATLKNNNIQVILNEDEGLQAFGHPNEFSQVILNVLANAKDALVANKAHHRRIEIELHSGGHSAEVVIRDNAGGIAEEAIAKVFDPYFTTKAGGTGIGLYMSKTIIEKHMGGNIICCNAGEGAEFSISIPLGTQEEQKGINE